MHAEMKCKKYMVYAYTNFTYLNICEQISYAMHLQMPNIFQKKNVHSLLKWQTIGSKMIKNSKHILCA